MRLVLKVGGILLCAGSFWIARASDDPTRLQGRWSINNWSPGDSLQLRMKYRAGDTRMEWGSSQPIADLHGLTLDQMHAMHTPVKFTLERDAGTFAFEGTVTLGVGSGDYRFVVDPTFKAKLGALGYDVVGEDDASLMMMAVRDISVAYAGEVKRSGLRDVAVGDLARLRDHGVDLGFIRDLAMIAYAGLSADDVVRLRDHGVASGFLRTLKASGYPDLPAADIVRLRDHGIEPAFIEDLLIAKPGPYSIDELIKLRDHGVDPRYVARIQEAGFKELTVDQIVSLREHGVD